MFSKSAGLKVCVRTMSWFRDTISFGICPAVLILHIPKQIPEKLSHEAGSSSMLTHQLTYDFGSVSGRMKKPYII